MKEGNNYHIKKQVSYAITIIITILGVYIGIVMVNNIKQPVNDNINSTNQGVLLNISNQDLSNLNVNVEKTEYAKYIQLAEKKSVKIINKRLISPEFTAADVQKNNEIALEFLNNNSKKISINGKIDSGYLYIKAGAGTIENLGPIASNESVYIYFGSSGGHLYKPASLVSTPSNDGLTQYLFKLDNIQFTKIPYSDNNKSYGDNWLNKLNNNQELMIGAFVSSASRFAVIEEVTIAYEGAGTIEIK